MSKKSLASIQRRIYLVKFSQSDFQIHSIKLQLTWMGQLQNFIVSFIFTILQKRILPTFKICIPTRKPLHCQCVAETQVSYFPGTNILSQDISFPVGLRVISLFPERDAPASTSSMKVKAVFPVSLQDPPESCLLPIRTSQQCQSKLFPSLGQAHVGTRQGGELT